MVGLLGPNGAGKTTSFYMIVGLVPADGGHITLNGQDLTHLPVHARARLGLGYLPQEASVFRKLTVEDNILAILETRPELTRADRKKRLEELLEELHIRHIRDGLGISAFGGERRRGWRLPGRSRQTRCSCCWTNPSPGVDPISVIDIQRIIEHLKARNIGVLVTDQPTYARLWGSAAGPTSSMRAR